MEQFCRIRGGLKLFVLAIALLSSLLVTACMDKTERGEVTYIADGHVLGVVQFVDGEPQASIPSVPSKEGYTGEWEEYELTTGNITVNAVYTPIEYTVSFAAEGVVVSSDIYTVEDREISVPSVPSKEGYTGEWEEYELTTGNITVNAVYTPIEYTVSFAAEGVVVSSDIYTVEDREISVPSVPSKEGYTGEWEEYELTMGNITVNAVYTPNSYVVSVLCDAGGICTTGGEYVYGSTVALTAQPYRGYDFAGWYEGDTLLCVQRLYDYSIPPRDSEIVAKFEARKEMLPFAFTSDMDSCIITGVKDDPLTEIVVPGYVTEVGYRAFAGCDELEKVTFSDSVTEIGDYAFYQCADMNEIDLGKGLREIGKYAFYQCGSLKNVILPESLHTIGMAAFTGCISLTAIGIPEMLTVLYDGTFSGCRALRSVVLSDGVASIGYGSFQYCESLQEVVFGKNVMEIHTSAFAECIGLKEVALPERLMFLGDRAFSGCVNLENITLADGLETIGSYAFLNCKALTDISIPQSVVRIQSQAFFGCDHLERVSIGRGVREIGSLAFSGCDKLTSAVFTDPNGWQADGVEISAQELSDPGSAAWFLREKYVNHTWMQN